MIVSAVTELEAVVSRLSAESVLAVDLETTALDPRTGRLFSLALASETEAFYLNFNPLLAPECLPFSALELLKPLFLDPSRTWVNHNIKFDLHFLAREGIEVAGTLWCTMVGARLERNDHRLYSLDACGERIGVKKDSGVKAYADKNKLFDVVKIPGKLKRVRLYHYEQIPIELMAPYAIQDVRVSLALYKNQKKVFTDWTSPERKPILPLLELEQKTTKVLLKMERHGIRVDREYCQRAAAFEENRILEAAREFNAQTGGKFVDSAKSLASAFKSFGIFPGTTAKGNDSFTSDVLEGIDHPLSKTILKYRNAKKRLGTYFSSFLYYSESDGRIHGNIRQSGTLTGRFSSSDPNLQNLSDEEDELFPVRRAFIADPETELLSLDYQAMEYRLLLDLSGQMDVIEEVKAGKDLHQACGDLMGVPRNTAKTINFMLLYGGGAQKLADTLKISKAQAYELKGIYFRALPQISNFIGAVTRTCALRQGVLMNPFGRRYFYSDPDFYYQGVNHVIQGACSDILRRAMVSLDAFLTGKESKLLLPIHDELVFSLAKKELDLIPYLKEAFIHAYPYRHLPMACQAYLGSTLQDLELVDGQGPRDEI